VIDRAQQVIGRAGGERPGDTTAFLVGSDHDDRDTGAARLIIQQGDKARGIKLEHLAGHDDKLRTLLGARAQRRRGIGVDLDRGCLTKRRGQPGENF
jgi:hypothetical protein